MKIIFFGTPEYVVPLLEGLHKAYNRNRERELIGVVTQPPKPVGREQKLEYSAVDTFAHHHKIPIYFDTDELPEADLAICAAYGKIIPQNVIDSFPMGILNVHPSLLPKLRGASPIQGTIVSGITQTGVSIIKMDELVDHGPIVSVLKSEVLPEDTNETLRVRLFQETVDFLLDLLPHYIAGKVTLKEQNDQDATFTKPIVKEDGYINPQFIDDALRGKTTDEAWDIRFMKDYSVTPSAAVIERYIRALASWPEAWTTIYITNEETSKRRLKIKTAHIEGDRLVLDQVQLEGKNPVTWAQFEEGYPNARFVA